MSTDRRGRPRQLAFGLPHGAGHDPRRLSRRRPPTAQAIDLIDRWPDWPAPAVLLAGPVGSGKSHLVEIWRGAQRRRGDAGRRAR